jgi:hypothetical protein
MYAPGLTLESGVEEISSPVQWFEWRLGKKSDFVLGRKLHLDCLQEIAALAEDAFVRDLAGNWVVRRDLLETQTSRLNLLFVADEAGSQVEDWLERHVVSSMRAKIDFESVSVQQLRFLRVCFWKALKEALLNAIEHGADFCSEGEVVLRTIINKKAEVMCVIDQPKKFNGRFELENLPSLAAQVARNQWLDEKFDGIPRGRGLNGLLHPSRPRVNYIQLEEGGFRTLLLGTLADVRRKTQ